MVKEMKRVRAIDVYQVDINLPLHDIEKIMDLVGDQSAAYFYDPDVCTHYFALSEAACCLLTGRERFHVAKQFLKDLGAWKTSGLTAPIRVFGGFSFVASEQPTESAWAEWPDGKLFLPRVLIECKENATFATVTSYQNHGEPIIALPEEGVSPEVLREWIQQVCDDEEWKEMHGSFYSHEEFLSAVHHQSEDGKAEWIRLVTLGSQVVQTGDLKKVVLAREVTEPVSRPISEIIHRLNDQYPSNFTFAFWHRGTCFLGSSPERLASVANGVLKVDCLAGSEARGKSKEEDEELGRGLLASRKNRAEHQAVVDRVAESIVYLVRDYQVEKEPVLKKLTNVQHLYTPVQGTVKDGVGIIDVVESLHPTPAVAGVPTREALRFIEENEHMDRGWWAGPIGFVDVSGNGTFAVSLRSGLLRDHHATLFAGAGIMADSDPETEWEETELKLMPMRHAIGSCRDRKQPAKGER
jgi:menaquinone-specific isochorismate synthase